LDQIIVPSGHQPKDLSTLGKKHVLIIGKYYPPEHGGVERYAADIARVAARKYRVTVLVHHTGPGDSVEELDGITIIRCGTKRIIQSQPISPSMWRYIWRLEPDLIQFNAPNFWAASALVLRRPKCPMIITHHADVFGRHVLKWLSMPFYSALVRRSSCVVVNSLKIARISPDIPPDVRHVREIPWGVDETIYRPVDVNSDAYREERRRRFGDAPVIGFVGRFVRYKGLSVLIEAMRRFDGAHAMLIGDGPLRPKIEREIKAAGLGGRVHLTGNITEDRKIREMSYMDVLAFPSLETTEGFGLVQVEAQFLGLSVVASNLPTGVTDVTIDKMTGLLVEPGDPAALCRALKLLCDDRALARRYGAAGRARALGNFTLRAFEERIASLLDDSIDRFGACGTTAGSNYSVAPVLGNSHTGTGRCRGRGA
jgi:glycosyltransferase involved in cell wall biosynthesis